MSKKLETFYFVSKICCSFTKIALRELSHILRKAKNSSFLEVSTL